MSKLAEAVRDKLNELCGEMSTSEIAEILECGKEYQKEYRETFEFEFEDKTLNVLDYDTESNHIGGDGGELGAWVEVPDGDIVYYVGVRGRYSSWEGPEWDYTFKIGTVKSWTESMFYYKR